MTAEEISLRKKALIEDFVRRLRPVCADWPEHEFMALIHRLAEITTKYETVSPVDTYDRRSTERLLADLNDTIERSRRHREESGRDDVDP